MCVYTFLFTTGITRRKAPGMESWSDRRTHFLVGLILSKEEELGKKSEHVYRHRGQEVRDSFFFLLLLLPLLPYSSKKRRKEVILHIPVILIVRKAWEKEQRKSTLTIIII